MSYKRKAPSQVKRDHTRAMAHRVKQLGNMPEQSAPERRVTRSSYKDSVIEEVRSDSFLPASPYMAVSPIDSHRHIPSDRSLLEHTPEYVPDVLDGSHTPPVTESDSLQEPDPDISMDTVSTGVDTDMEDQVFAVGTQV